MKCADTRALLSSYLDKSLMLEQRIEVEAHLIACERCSSDAAELRHIAADLRCLEILQPPVEIRRKVRSILLQERNAKVRSAPESSVLSVLMPWHAHAKSALSYTGLGLASAALAFVVLFAPSIIRHRGDPSITSTYRPETESEGRRDAVAPLPSLGKSTKVAERPAGRVSAPPSATSRTNPAEPMSKQGTQTARVETGKSGARRMADGEKKVTVPTEAKTLIPNASASATPDREPGRVAGAAANARSGAAAPLSGREPRTEPRPAVPALDDASGQGVKSAGKGDPGTVVAEAPRTAVAEDATLLGVSAGAPVAGQARAQAPPRAAKNRTAMRTANSSAAAGGAATTTDMAQQNAKPVAGAQEDLPKGAAAPPLQLSSFEVDSPKAVEPREPFDVLLAIKPREDIPKCAVSVRLPVQVALVKEKGTVSGGEHEIYAGVLRSDQITRLKIRLQTIGQGSYAIRLSVESREPRLEIARKSIEIKSAER
ncbi:MAG: hypothetical protein GW893_03950 [Armatimonadetes bacterium]|nr:hypothetical protein [Armatimonadota bacterium]